MVGFHSFVCTFGEGLLCARPCARQQVNGHGPWECTPRADAGEPVDGREPGPGRLGCAGRLECVGLTVWVRGGSAQVLLSGFCKASPPVPTFFPTGSWHLRMAPGPQSLPACSWGSLLPGPWHRSGPSGSLSSLYWPIPWVSLFIVPFVGDHPFLPRSFDVGSHLSLFRW